MLFLLDPRAQRAYQSRDTLARSSSTSSNMRVTTESCTLDIDLCPSRLVTLGPLSELSPRKYERCLLRKTTSEHFLNESSPFCRTLISCLSVCALASLVLLQTSNAFLGTHSRSVSHVLHQESFVILSFLLPP